MTVHADVLMILIKCSFELSWFGMKLVSVFLILFQVTLKILVF